MQITKILASKTIVFNLIISLTLIYLFLAFLPTIHLINPGLDASRSYGISQAAKEKLVFGKEIVFTYGPLGYLMQGAALSGSSLLFMLNQQTRCQDNILLTQKFRKFLKP